MRTLYSGESSNWLVKEIQTWQETPSSRTVGQELVGGGGCASDREQSRHLVVEENSPGEEGEIAAAVDEGA